MKKAHPKQKKNNGIIVYLILLTSLTQNLNAYQVHTTTAVGLGFGRKS